MATVAALARTNLAYMTIFALTHVWSQFSVFDKCVTMVPYPTFELGGRS